MDPQFFGDLELDAAPLLDYINEVRQGCDVHLTMTHLVGKAVAHGLSEVPELRVRLAHGREYARTSVDVFFIVTTASGRELTGVKVHSAADKSVVEIATELTSRLAAIQAGDDPELGRGKALLARLPPAALRVVLHLGAWLTSDLNLDLSRLGLPRQAFGGAMITSVGMWGIGHAYSPLAHYYRVPVLILVGAVRDCPAVVRGEVVARPMLTITATFDHRFVDGYHAAQFAAAVRDYCEKPTAFEPALPSRQGSGRPTQRPGTDPAAGR
jgi:pyruvate/2-oxoglutarate dehydrogenase complex dihydrolipoamide acyltransferase (E2) component